MTPIAGVPTVWSGCVGAFVVGFDLDMTLVDSRPGILDTLAALEEETGVAVSGPAMLDALLRRNLDLEFAERFPPTRARELADRFRQLYAELGVPGTFLLPGADRAVDAVHESGGKVVVITAKYEPNARRCLDHVGLRVGHEVDGVDGWRYGPQKADAIVEHGVAAYVGDTTGDVRAALAAGAHSVAVPTGPHPPEELTAAGAREVLSSLLDFPAWLALWLGSRAIA